MKSWSDISFGCAEIFPNKAIFFNLNLIPVNLGKTDEAVYEPSEDNELLMIVRDYVSENFTVYFYNRYLGEVWQELNSQEELKGFGVEYNTSKVNPGEICKKGPLKMNYF